MTRPVEYIKLARAKKMAGCATYKEWRGWLERWNLNNPDRLILCRPARVELHSLEAALAADAEKHTPGMQAKRALASMEDAA